MIIYFTWDSFGEVNVMKIVNDNVVEQGFCLQKDASLNVSHIICVLNCSLLNKAYCKTHCCSWCKG